MKLHHKQELFRLMTGLLYAPLKTGFSMERYAVRSDDCSTDVGVAGVLNECGTTACAAGHAPLFCITPVTYDWEDYLETAFGIYDDRPNFSFLFSSTWPNVKIQAAARMYKYLMGGGVAPETITWAHTAGGERVAEYEVPTRKQVAALGSELEVEIVTEVQL